MSPVDPNQIKIGLPAGQNPNGKIGIPKGAGYNPVSPADQPTDYEAKAPGQRVNAAIGRMGQAVAGPGTPVYRAFHNVADDPIFHSAPAAPSTGAGSPEGAHIPGTPPPDAAALNAHYAKMGIGGEPQTKTVGVQGSVPAFKPNVGIGGGPTIYRGNGQPERVGGSPSPVGGGDPAMQAMQAQMKRFTDYQARYPNAHPLDVGADRAAELATQMGAYQNNRPEAQSRMLESIAGNPDAMKAFLASRGMDYGQARPFMGAGIGLQGGVRGGPVGVQQPAVHAGNVDQYMQYDNPAMGQVFADPDTTYAQKFQQLRTVPGMNDPGNPAHQAFAEMVRRQVTADPAGFTRDHSYSVPNPATTTHPLGGFGKAVAAMTPEWLGGPRGMSANASHWQSNYDRQNDFRSFLLKAGINPDTGQLINPQ
jgi:hypothetical protein